MVWERARAKACFLSARWFQWLIAACRSALMVSCGSVFRSALVALRAPTMLRPLLVSILFSIFFRARYPLIPRALRIPSPPPRQNRPHSPPRNRLLPSLSLPLWLPSLYRVRVAPPLPSAPVAPTPSPMGADTSLLPISSLRQSYGQCAPFPAPCQSPAIVTASEVCLPPFLPLLDLAPPSIPPWNAPVKRCPIFRDRAARCLGWTLCLRRRLRSRLSRPKGKGATWLPRPLGCASGAGRCVSAWCNSTASRGKR